MNADRVAWHYRTYTRRRSRCDQVARFQGHKSSDKSEYSTGIEDHVRDRGVLFHFAVNGSLDAQRCEIDLGGGKVYVADQVETATERFFRTPNLLALRELALRRTADRVDAAAQEYRGGERTSRPWLARDRFIVAVAPDDQAEQLVRVGKRFAGALASQLHRLSRSEFHLLERVRIDLFDVPKG